MMWQRLDGRGSLATAVQQVLQGALGDLVPPEKRVVEQRVSSNTGALSRARKRLPREAVEAVCDQIFANLMEPAQASGGLQSRLFLIDEGGSQDFPPCDQKYRCLCLEARTQLRPPRQRLSCVLGMLSSLGVKVPCPT